MTDSLTALLDDLRPRFAERLLTSVAAREHHCAGESHLPAQWPDAVVMARSTEDVSQMMRATNAHGVPVIPFGAGSSLEGQIHAPSGGISLDLSEMDGIIAVNLEDMDCTVACGVTRQALNAYLRDTGLFFPVDLGAHASLGDMASPRASGTTTVRYGSMRDLVLGLTVVMLDQQIIRTGGRARKSAAGYDLTRLMIGAEAALGAISKLTSRLFGVCEAARSAMCSFASIHEATEMVVTALQCGPCLNRIELADTVQMQAINSYCGTDLPEHPTLWIELTGSQAQMAHDMALLRDLAEGAIRFDGAETAERQEVQHISQQLVKVAIDMGGTSTGEHGVGLGKKPYLETKHGPALDVMRQIKRALDPAGFMNPGKIFDL